MGGTGPGAPGSARALAGKPPAGHGTSRSRAWVPPDPLVLLEALGLRATVWQSGHESRSDGVAAARDSGGAQEED
jgi:hypothetical protein